MAAAMASFTVNDAITKACRRSSMSASFSSSVGCSRWCWSQRSPFHRKALRSFRALLMCRSPCAVIGEIGGTLTYVAASRRSRLPMRRRSFQALPLVITLGAALVFGERHNVFSAFRQYHCRECRGNLQTAINNAVPGGYHCAAGRGYVYRPVYATEQGRFWLDIHTIQCLRQSPASGDQGFDSGCDKHAENCRDRCGATAIQTNAQAHHYRFVGIEIRPAAGQFVFNLVNIGNGETSLANLPHDISFDRCYVHGDPIVGGRRGIAMNGASVAVVDSYVSDFKEVSADTQALASWNGAGPFKIVNNYLEAAGENVIFGGY